MRALEKLWGECDWWPSHVRVGLHAQFHWSVVPAIVYRALQGLADSGQGGVFRRLSGEALFRLCNPVRHHHLLCQRHGRAEKIDACEVEPWAVRVARQRGFTL